MLRVGPRAPRPGADVGSNTRALPLMVPPSYTFSYEANVAINKKSERKRNIPPEDRRIRGRERTAAITDYARRPAAVHALSHWLRATNARTTYELGGARSSSPPLGRLRCLATLPGQAARTAQRLLRTGDARVPFSLCVELSSRVTRSR